MTSFGAFEIGRVLGTGGSGTVYAARAPQWSAEIALKVLREDAALTERERARFMDEAARMRRVSHPALVGVLDAGFLPDGRPYVAMPLVAGEPLAARIARGRLPLRDALSVFEDLAGAVSAVHAAGLVHRDVKPENVMVADRDGRARGTLLDLGIARDADGPASTTTKLGNVRGTPAYMALERFFGTPASVSSDVYELSVTLYMMLTGTLPWRSAEDATERISPMHPMQAGVMLPEPLTQALMRGLAAKPDGRFRNVGELANAVMSAARDSNDANATTTAVAAMARPIPPAAASSGGSFAPPPQPSDPQGFASTTLAPQRPPMVPAMSAPPASGGGSGLIAIAVFGGIIAVGGLLSLAVYARGGRASPAVPPPSAVVTAAPAAPSASASAPHVAPSLDPFAAPTHNAPPPPHHSSSPSPASPAPSSSAGQMVLGQKLSSCNALHSTYCSDQYKQVDASKCLTFGQAVTNHWYTPDEAAQKDRDCRNENLAVMQSLASRKH